MAKRKTVSKRTAKKVAKAAKKYPKVFLALACILLVAAVVIAVLWFTGVIKFPSKEPVEDGASATATSNSGVNEGSGSSSSDTPISVNGNVQIYSIEMRDMYGDSLYIKYGDVDILIDAGDTGDGEYVRNFVDAHISSDRVLDLLIVTHCHSDHMGGLVSYTNSDKNGKALDNVREVSNIIDFGHQRGGSETGSGKKMYNNYVTLRQEYIDNGANYYPAYDAVHHTDGMQSVLTFGDLSVEIIDTNYYGKTTDVLSDSLNEYSVATLITYKNTKLFCAGDLEDHGEASLVANANNTSLKDIQDSDTVIYKSCHHGTDVGDANTSATSTNGGNRMALLKIIKPDYCFISSAIGQSDHPYVRAVVTMLYFTDKVYFNGTMGTVCFDLDGTNVGISGAGATTNYTLDGITIDYEAEKNLVYTETAWYKNHKYEASTSWYTGESITEPTDQQLTEWYLAQLRA